MQLIQIFLNLSIRQKFLSLLLVLVVVSVGSFASYEQYSVNEFKREFEKRGALLTKTLSNQAHYNLVMEDYDGLEDMLKTLQQNKYIEVGAFYNAGATQVVGVNVDVLPESDLQISGDFEELSWTYNKNGEKLLLARHKIATDANPDDVLGFVQIALPADALAEQESAGFLILLGGTFVFLMIGLLVLWVFQKVTITPVKELSFAAEKVADGNFDVRVYSQSNDEIGVLIESFNQMVQNNRDLLAEANARSSEAEIARKKSEEMQQKVLEEQSYLQFQFEKIETAITAVTAGDLTQELTIDRDDAVGMLMQKINAMIRDLNSLIGQMHYASESVADASGQIASSVDELSKGAGQQAIQTQEVAKAIEEMSQTVNHSSQSASDAAQIARQTSMLADSGERIFRTTLDGMKNVAQIVRDSAGTVEKLGQSSREIGEIVQVIDDIADQTNLLALNAAIEAARAGDQGRGFAVVADEVRKLAERTTSATSKIAEMIKRIQNETHVVVEAMEQGSTEAEKGMKMADKATESLTEVISSITRITENINQIASGIQRQSSTGEDITIRVDQISTEARNVSEATDELSNISLKLNQLTRQLYGSVKHFVIRKETAQSWDTVYETSGNTTES